MLNKIKQSNWWLKAKRDSYIFDGQCEKCEEHKPVNKFRICERCDKVNLQFK